MLTLCTRADLDRSTMFFDDFFADPQSQAVADGALRGEEGLEYLRQSFRTDASAIVGDDNSDEVSSGLNVL